MSDRRSFLQAMIDAPEDDTPRLVYADWLEEHGAGEADRDRAEFIRVQVELARLRFASKADPGAARYEVLRSREGGLYRHHKLWASELNLPPKRGVSCVFRRGMVADVWCSVRYFVEHADALFAAAPLEAVCFRRATLRNVAELATCRGFARLRGVKFLLTETPQEVIARFFAILPAGHLHAAELFTFVVDPRSPNWHTRNVVLVVALARCPGLAGLKRLLLRDAGVGDEGALALARSPHLAGLELLGLEGNAFSPAVEAELRERFGRRLCLGQPDHAHFTLGELGWA
jgi:uncharacterized protein (TIGR02996 family)